MFTETCISTRGIFGIIQKLRLIHHKLYIDIETTHKASKESSIADFAPKLAQFHNALFSTTKHQARLIWKTRKAINGVQIMSSEKKSCVLLSRKYGPFVAFIMLELYA